jgi:hypothetical protein
MKIWCEGGRAIAAAVLVAAVLAWAAPAAQASPFVFIDEFDRPDGTDLGPYWTEQACDWRLEGGLARTQAGEPSCAIALLNGYAWDEPSLLAMVHAVGSPRPTYAALVARYLDDDNCLFVKVQDNNLDGAFDVVVFYLGNNSLTPWSGMTDHAGAPANYWQFVTPFTQAYLGLTVAGDQVIVTLDRDFDGTPEDVIIRGGVPAGLGQRVGMGGYNEAAIGDFIAMPEPATAILLGLGVAGMVFMPRRRC